MQTLGHLFDSNREWARQINERDPEFFQKLSLQQRPAYLWIGCADSRVPANEIVGLPPGEMFVHRNVANVVVHSDLNCLSVVQYAVEVLQVQHIIVCGHYGCGGVQAALAGGRFGLIDNWLRHVQDVMITHDDHLADVTDGPERVNRLCELNVIEQVQNVCRTTIVQDAWLREQSLSVHGWIYGITDGLLQDLSLCVRSEDELDTKYRLAIERVTTSDETETRFHTQ